MAITHRYWRWKITDLSTTANDTLQVTEVELRNGGSSVSWVSVATTSPDPNSAGPGTFGWYLAGGEPVTNLTDGNLSNKGTCFADTANVGFPVQVATVVIDAGGAVTADSFRYMTGNDHAERDPVSWTLEYLDDASAWTVCQTSTRVSITASRSTWTQDFAFSGGGSSTPYPVANAQRNRRSSGRYL